MLESWTGEPGDEYTFDDAATDIAADLFEEQSYAYLTETDLRTQGYLGPDETMLQFVKQTMHFDESLQPSAYELFCSEAPPPLDTTELLHWQNRVPMAPADENRFRLEMFDELSEPEVYHPQINHLNEHIILAADAALIGEAEADPQLIKQYLTQLKLSGECDPEIIQYEGKSCWALKIARPNSTDFTEPATPDTVNLPPKFLIVTDSDQNAKLTSQILANQDLVQYFVMKYVGKLQWRYREDLRESFHHAAIEKSAEARFNANEINQQLRLKFFELLVKDATSHPLEIIVLSRDPQTLTQFPTAHLSGFPLTMPDKVVKKFSVTTASDHEIVFRWQEPGISAIKRYEADGSVVTTELPANYTNQVTVTIDEGELSFNSREWGQSTPDLQNDLEIRQSRYDSLLMLFRYLVAVTKENMLRYGQQFRQMMQPAMDMLLQAENSTQFVQLLKEYKFAHYPAREIIINPGSKVKFVIQTTFVPPGSDIRAN